MHKEISLKYVCEWENMSRYYFIIITYSYFGDIYILWFYLQIQVSLDSISLSAK